MKVHFILFILASFIIFSCQSTQEIIEGEDIMFVEVDDAQTKAAFNNDSDKNKSKLKSVKSKARKPLVVRPPKKKPRKVARTKTLNRPKETAKKTLSSRNFTFKKKNPLRKEITINKGRKEIIIKKKVIVRDNRLVPISEESLEDNPLDSEENGQYVNNDLYPTPYLYEGNDLMQSGYFVDQSLLYNYSLTDVNSSVTTLLSFSFLISKVHEIGVLGGWTPHSEGNNLFLPELGYELQFGIFYHFRLAISFFTFTAGIANGLSYYSSDIMGSTSYYYVSPNIGFEFQLSNFLSIGIPISPMFFFGAPSTNAPNINFNRVSSGITFVWRFLD